MRGFLGGVSLGALAAVVGAALWSLAVPLPPRVETGGEEPAAQTPGPEAGAEKPESPEVAAPEGDADIAEILPAIPGDTPEGDDLSALEAGDTDPGGRPEVSSEASGLDDPGSAAEAPDVAAVSDTPPRAPQAGSAPQAPGSESDIEVSSEPAPQLPAAPAEESVETPAAEPEAEPAAEEAVPAAPAPQVAMDAPEITAPEDAEAPAALPQVTAPPDRQPVPGERRESAEAAAPAAEEEDAEASPQIGAPVVPFTEREEGAIAEAPQSVSPALLPPFEAYSEPFDNPDGRPLMSIVLIDDAKSVGAEALAGFPYPLSFAIDPSTPDAAEKMAARRAAGFEVLVLADLPRQAAPQDAETALPVWLETLPEAIGVLEGTGTGVQGSRALADQVSALAAAHGLGLVVQNNGLNTVQKLAARGGVPSGVVFRDFDGAGQDPRAIRRFLDQAAFRAGQEGAVIMLGRVRPDTISALLLWGLQDRASRVSLAPVSASMRAALPEG